MRYICKQTVVTTVSDQEFSNLEEIKSLISFLKEKEINCSIQLNGYPKFDLVRITSITEHSVSFRVIKSHGNLEKTCSYSDIILLEVNVSDEDLIRTKIGISRWMLLSPIE